jgi:hypothetical protein
MIYGYAGPYLYPTYRPSVTLIAAITNAVTAQVTTTFAHNYQPLLVVRILVAPPQFGMAQIDQQVGTILTVIDSLNFTLSIDTSQYAPFVYPVSLNAFTNAYPSCVPVGEDNSTLYQALQNVL